MLLALFFDAEHPSGREVALKFMPDRAHLEAELRARVDPATGEARFDSKYVLANLVRAPSCTRLFALGAASRLPPTTCQTTVADGC